ncbi:Primary amine oxidase precursor [Pseudovibrio sp. Ad13]|uniref:copper amine oxidase n=1 Tax=Pseudovibrio sp. Ad13 TaxID=989396 RepID=UPI0007AE6049|nr:tyramine oxidase [Pseudovibrio sp. Ad13]KZK75969.1 Primary amine oxidase precursor [Pseudovibrio sp. Ad13]
MTLKMLGGLVAASMLTSAAYAADPHPLDGLTGDELNAVRATLIEANAASDKTLYPLIELLEPHKKAVMSNATDGSLDRRATVHFQEDGKFHQAVVNITKGTVESRSDLEGQPMIMLADFLSAMEIALGDERMVAGLAKRGLTPDDVYCLPLTAGNFFTDAEKGKRLMKVPCYVNPTSSNFYAKPVEGLVAVVELSERKVLEVIDEGAVPLPEDDWGYNEDEVAKRTALRAKTNPARLRQEGGPNFTIDGSEITWDIWKMRYRVDKRPGLVLSQVKANDGANWRSVLYQASLSEVFVPYMDPSAGWYWRTYMDSGEYGFGLFLTPLRKNVDCPDYATFLPALIHDDMGQPLEIPDAICIFERDIGNPAWRHFEVFAQSETEFVPAEGRPETELVIRTASEVGNYDYLIDYRFKQDGTIYLKVGASGLDAVKGVASKSLQDPTAAEDTKYGSLIAPHLVAPFHDHYFNFRLDFDVDGPDNTMMVQEIVGGEPPVNVPRRSLWTVKNTPVKSEMEGRFRLSSMKPKAFMVMNGNVDGYLGHKPAYMLHHGSVSYAPFDFENDAPFVRNRYIEYSVWNTAYDPNERYAGGALAMGSDGSDGLAEWVKQDRQLMNKDVVTWFTAGFHHVPRLEDWPVMSTEWKTIHIQPMNFFPRNPALTIRLPDESS